MANVFVSYARDDRALIQPHVSALEAEGLSVWWDPALIPGRRFRQMIAQELATADSVLVIWTRQALESDWVQDEAEEARQRGVLIPVIMEPVTPPAGFRQLQAADLSQWTGRPEHPEFKALIHACRALAQWSEKERSQAPATPPYAPPPRTEALAASPEPATVALEPTPEAEPVPGPEPARATARIVRFVARPAFGWSVTLGLALILFGLAASQDKGVLGLKLSLLSLVGLAASFPSRLLVQRGLTPQACWPAVGGGAMGILFVLATLTTQRRHSWEAIEYATLPAGLVIFALGGYAIGAWIGVLMTLRSSAATERP